METNHELDYLSAIYGNLKVMTINDLKKRIVVSEITIRRKLKKSKAITSYNMNGRYYTLPHLPMFDSWGLWNYNDIRFSKYGNLNQTIIQLIHHSPSGLQAETIGRLIEYAPHSLLHRLAVKSNIRREKLFGKYVYFSYQQQVYQTQLDQFKSKHTGYSAVEVDIPCQTAVMLLIEKIKGPKDNNAQIVKRLLEQNVTISELQVERFFEKNGIKKKRV